MRTRITAILAAVAITLAVTAAALVTTNLTSEPTGVSLNVWSTAPVDPSLPPYPALPSADHLPASFTDAERASATLWIEQQTYVTECMVDAGLTDFASVAAWQPGLPENPIIAWQHDLSDAELERSAQTWFGTGVNGDGADYDWKAGGCNGYGWHMVGLDHPY